MDVRRALRVLHEEMNPGRALAAIDVHVARQLPARPAKQGGEKIVKDSIWGVITLPSFLVPLVDTQLLQRQRRIRQLGFSFLTYPTAGYGRFEHALGASHVMRVLVQAMKGRGADGGLIDERTLRVLMIAALLHDVGHMPFSHASERWLDEIGERLTFGGIPLLQIRRRVANDLGRPALKLAELISVMVLLSPSLHAHAAYLSPDPQEVEDLFVLAAAYVAGVPTGPDDVCFAQMLSGPLDVDRLDYMARDSSVCGIPIAVDVERLLARCQIARVPPDKLPIARREALEDRFGDVRETSQFVTDLSGANALEEMAMSRMVLYDRVYHHQKTLCAEATLADLLVAALESGTMSAEVLEFWAQTDDGFLHRCAGAADGAVRDPADRLLFRRLPRRALAYGQRLVEAPVLPEHEPSWERRRCGDDAVRKMLTSIDEAFSDRDERVAITAEIRREALALAPLLGASAPTTGLEQIVVAPRPQSPLGSVGEALVYGSGGTVDVFSDVMPLEPWSAAFMLNKSAGFVYCDPDWRAVVHVATERVLWRAFSGAWSGPNEFPIEARFRAMPSSLVLAKVNGDEIAILKALADATPGLARVRGVRACVARPSQIEAVAGRLAGFQCVTGWAVTREHVAAFVRQFDAALQNDIVEQILLRIEVLNRHHVVPDLRELISRETELRGDGGADVVGLSPNSGELWRQLLEADLRASLGDRVRFLRDGAVEAGLADRGLFLVDDLFASGSQACCQLQAWLGVPREQWLDPRERNVRDAALAPDLQASIRARPVRLVFARGSAAGRAKMQEVASTLGLTDFDVLMAGSLPDVRVENPNAALLARLRDVGTALLGQHGNAQPAVNAMGGGGETGLVVGMFNAPTCLPAALWCPGVIDDTPWRPLVLRRGYQGSFRVC